MRRFYANLFLKRKTTLIYQSGFLGSIEMKIVPEFSGVGEESVRSGKRFWHRLMRTGKGTCERILLQIENRAA